MSEELDELASAYADGEASEEEISRVESDPALLDLVEEFRALRASNAPLPEPEVDLRDRQIASALDVFDELALGNQAQSATIGTGAASRPTSDGSASDGSAANTANVTPFERPQTKPQSPQVRASEPGRRNRWLLNAAAVMVLLGGVGFALTQLPGNDSDDSAALDTSEESTDMAEASASGADTSRSSDGDAAASSQEAGAALTDDAASDQAEQASADTDELAGGESADEAAEESVDAAEAADADESTSTTDTASTDRPPAFEVSGTESTDEILTIASDTGAMATDLVTPDASPCFLSIDLPPAGIEFGFVPFLYGTTIAQLLVYDDGGNQQAIVVDAGTCAVLAGP